MNQKELNEIRRRIAPNKCGISKLYGCFVNNSSKEIISRIDTSLGLLSEFENEKYLSLLKKVLSGGLGKNLIDITFSTQQVMKGEEHKLLADLRNSGLNDPALREAFFQKVISAVTMEDTNYLILLAYDSYDVPYKGKDDVTQADASDTVYNYILCSVCPVKDGKPELAYFPGENQFHSSGISHIVSPPALGFLFPAFDDRAANIYNALYYAKDPNELHQTFIDTVFATEPPMSAGKQKETFHSVLSDALDDDCSFDVLQQVHEQIREVILDHKESKDPNPLELSASDLGTILKGGRRPRRAGPGLPAEVRPGVRPGRPPEAHQPHRQQEVYHRDPPGKDLRGPGGQLPGGDPDHRRPEIYPHPRRRRGGGQRHPRPVCRRKGVS